MSRTSVFAKLASLLNASGQLLSGGVADGAVTYAKLSSDVQGDMNQFKNRIINGAMMIDQRNAGASVTVTDSLSTYITDRWQVFENGAMSFTAQQSSTAPAGFAKSLLVTSTAAVTPASAARSAVTQIVEGFNIADFGWGAAGASAVTLSFWIRSSLTGQFGGALQNAAQDYSYPFSFTINSANTWEYKTITIAGPTAGTWNTDNSGGVRVSFDLGMGSTLLGTAGIWAGADYRGASGDTRINGTNGATLYITGVQLEKGSTATAFDYRPYGAELILCQRYFQSFKRAGEDSNQGWIATSYNANSIYMPVQFFTAMRRVPDVLSGGAWRTRQSNLNTFTGSFGYQQSGLTGCVLAQSASTNAANSVFWVEPDGSYSSAYLGFNAEL